MMVPTACPARPAGRPTLVAARFDLLEGMVYSITLNCETAVRRLVLGLLVGLFLISQSQAAPPPTKAPLALFLGHDRLAIVDANGDLWRYGVNGLPSMQKTGSGFVSVNSQYALRKNGQLDLPDSDLPWQGNQPDPKHGGLPAALRWARSA